MASQFPGYKLMQERTVGDFQDWLSGGQFYIGYNRYGYEHGHGFLVVFDYAENDSLEGAVSELSAGDNDAIDAMDYIIENAEWFECDPDPATAMQCVINKVSHYYYKILNGD